jgi:O-antigen ligase
MTRLFLFFYLLVIIFIGCNNIYLEIDLFQINILITFLSFLFLCITFVFKKERPSLNYGLGSLSITLMLFLFYSATSFYNSSNADVSYFPAIKILSALFLALALLDFIKNIDVIKKLLLLIFIFAGIHASIGILQQFIPSLLHQPDKFSSASTSLFHNPNFYSGYLVIHIPIGFYFMTQARNNYLKALFTAIWLTIWVALGFSTSPGGQLVAGIQMFALIVYFLKNKESSNLKFLGWSLVFSLGVYVGLVNILDYINQTSSETVASTLVRRPLVWGHIENRLMYWSGAWSIFKDNWILGSGLWTFYELYPQTGFKYTPPHAHSMYVQTAAETGLIGFGLLMVCLATLYSNIVRIFKKASAQVVDITFYVGLSISGFLIHNLIEYNWLVSSYIYLFILLVIIIEVLSREIKEAKTLRFFPEAKGIYSKSVILLMVLGMVTVIQFYHYNRLVSPRNLFGSTYEDMTLKTNQASKLCGRCGDSRFLMGVANWDIFNQSQEKFFLDQAEREFMTALEKSPNNLKSLMFLGDIKSLQGDLVSARKYYERAMVDSRYKENASLKLKAIEK